MSSLNLFQRINEVRKSTDYIRKDKSVSAGAGSSYKAVTHDQVTGMVRDHMVTHGIVCYPVLVESFSNSKEVNAQMETAKQFRYDATYDFHFVNIDDPKDELVIRIQSHAMDNGDKAPGKALSYAKKYAILKLFEIETGEDEESRYQEKEVVSVEFHSDMIRNSTSLDELESNWLEAKAQAKAANDASAFKALSSLVKQVKAKIEGGANA